MVAPASVALCLFLVAAAKASANPAFAFTYTTATQDWRTETADYKAVYVYAGDVELYCRGSPTATAAGGASNTSIPCDFAAGRNQNAFVYYGSSAKAAAASYKAAGKTVYLNFDGRISPRNESYVPDFSLLSSSEISQFAATVAELVCADANVDGMGWDVEPFDNNQVDFFAALDASLTACGKRWGVFAFGEDLSDDMWLRGLGSSGFLLDSTYDLDCTQAQLPNLGCQPCQCTPPSVYAEVLLPHLYAVMAKAKIHKKPYRLMVSGSASTQLYEQLSDPTCSSAGGGGMHNASCPYTMSDWMAVAVQAFNTAQVKADPLFEGVGVYGYTMGNGGGFKPAVPPSAVIALLKTKGYLPFAGSPAPPAKCSWQTENLACVTDKDCTVWANDNCEATQKVMGYCRASKFCHFSGVSLGGSTTRARSSVGDNLLQQKVGRDHFMLGSPMNCMNASRCDVLEGRPDGCQCNHSWVCASQWCSESRCLPHTNP